MVGPLVWYNLRKRHPLIFSDSLHIRHVITGTGIDGLSCVLNRTSTPYLTQHPIQRLHLPRTARRCTRRSQKPHPIDSRFSVSTQRSLPDTSRLCFPLNNLRNINRKHKPLARIRPRKISQARNRIMPQLPRQHRLLIRFLLVGLDHQGHRSRAPDMLGAGQRGLGVMLKDRCSGESQS